MALVGETPSITNTTLEAAVRESGVVVAKIVHSRPTVGTADKFGLMTTEDIGQTNDAVRGMIRPSMLNIRWYDIALATTLTARLPGNEVCLVTFLSDGSEYGHLTSLEIGQLLRVYGYEVTKATRNRTKLGPESRVELGSLGLGEGWASPFGNGSVPHFLLTRPFYGEHHDDGSGQVLIVVNFALNPRVSLLVRGGEVPRLIQSYYRELGVSNRSMLLCTPYPDERWDENTLTFVFSGIPPRVKLN
jgi:hypothetical protein